MNSEYIRTDHRRSPTSLMGTVHQGRGFHLTFLHAGHASWPSWDEGSGRHGERGHSHPVYHVIFFTGGRNSIVHDGQVHQCNRGTLVLTDPGMVHEYRPHEPGGSSFLEITFDLRDDHGAPLTHSFQDLLRSWTGVEKPPSTWPRHIPPPTSDGFEQVLSSVVASLREDSPISEAEATWHLGRFFLDLIHFFSEKTTGFAQVADGLEGARLYLDRHFDSDVAVSDLASIAGMSNGAFIRAFSKRFGETPISYRKSLRVTAAQYLLSVTGRPVGEIAESVGYGDIYAFSRAFKGLVGSSPTLWRKKQRT